VTAWAAALGIVVLFVHIPDLSTSGPLDRSGRMKGGDYVEFYALGTLAAEQRWHQLYVADAHRDVVRRRVAEDFHLNALHPNYSPLVAAALAPLTKLPYLTSLSTFWSIGIAAYACGTLVLTRSLRNLRRYPLAVVCCAIAFPSFAMALRYGQLTPFSWAAFALAIAAVPRSESASGLATGLLAFKPTLLLPPLLLFALSGRLLMLAAAAATTMVHLLLNVAVAGPGPVRDYWQVLIALAREPALVEPHPENAHAWRGFAQLLCPEPTASALAIIGSVASLALTWGVWRSTRDWRLRWAVTILFTVLAAPHLMTYDLLLLGIPVLLLSDWLIERPRAFENQLAILLVANYFAAAISPPIAIWTGVQLSTLVTFGLLVATFMGSRRDPLG